MVIINSYSNKRFTLNGIQYLKNYISRVSGNRVQIYNCYDNGDVLAGYDIYSNYIVNGETFNNAVLLQEALLDVIFSRGTLGNDVQELIQDNQRKVFDVEIETQDTEAQILAKINTLPLYLVDEHSLVSYKCYDGSERVLIYNTVGIGKGSYGIGGTQLTLANLLKVYEYIPPVTQNNIHRIRTYTAQDTGSTPTTAQVATLINSNFPISFSETDVPWIAVNMLGTTPLKKHIYWFTGGKGLWGGLAGGGGSTVNRSMLQYMLTQNATPQDVQDGGNTSVIPLGVLSNSDYITAANAVERDLDNPDLYYFLKFTLDGTEYLLQFTGSEYGLYGGGNTLQFTESDFEEMPVTESQEPYIPSLRQITDGPDNGYTNKPIFVESLAMAGEPISKTVYSSRGISHQSESDNWVDITWETPTVDGITYTIPAKDTDDTFMMLNDMPSSMPDDFFVAGNANGSTLCYKTNTYKYIDLQPLLPLGTGITIINLQEIVRDRDNLILTGNFIYGIEAPNAIMVVLEGIKLVNNIMKIGKVTATTLPTYRIHGLKFNRGFAFTLNRPDDAIGSTLVKINPYDLSDVKTYTFPSTTQYLGNSTDLLIYKDKLYMLFARGGTLFSYFVEVDENLTSDKVLFTSGNINSQNRVRASSPFIIYNDEIYIPTYSGTAPSIYNTMGMSVYGFDGTIKRSVQQIPITTGFTSGTPYAHWMTIFNGKILIANQASGSAGEHRELTRWDSNTLALEEVIQLTISATDDNTVTKDGYLFLNGEINAGYSGTSDLTPKLIKVKYNDFADYTVEINSYFDGYGSGASIGYYPAMGTNKYKLSQFVNDMVLKATHMFVTTTTTITTANIGSNGFLYIYANASSGNITINLPAATALSGYSVWVCRTDNTSNTVTIDANGSELINQSLTYSLTGQNSNAKFTSDGTQIRVFN